MLTIWNKFIQTLVLSHDKRSLKLACLLIDNPEHIYHFSRVARYCNHQQFTDLNLPLFIFPNWHWYKFFKEECIEDWYFYGHNSPFGKDSYKVLKLAYEKIHSIYNNGNSSN